MKLCKVCNKSIDDMSKAVDGMHAECAAKAADTVIDTEVLRKALDAAAAVADSTPAARKLALAKKVGEGTATADESVELVKLMSGQAADGSLPLGEQLLKALQGKADGELVKAIDVTPALAEFTSLVGATFKELGDRIEKTLASPQDISVAAIRAVNATGRVMLQVADRVEQLTKRVDAWGEQPAGRPRGVTGANAPAGAAPGAGEAGAGAEAQQIPMRHVLSEMESWMQEAISKNDQATAQALAQQIIKVESTKKIDPGLLAQVQKRLAN